MIQFMGPCMGGITKDDKLGYRLCGAMIGRKSQGIQILKHFHARGSLAHPLAPNKIIMGA